MGYVEQNVVVFQQTGDFAAVAAGKGNHLHIAFVGGVNGFDNVGGIAGSGDAHQNITGAAERAHLFAENMVETVIVADGGEGGSVGGERDGG